MLSIFSFSLFCSCVCCAYILLLAWQFVEFPRLLTNELDGFYGSAAKSEVLQIYEAKSAPGMNQVDLILDWSLQPRLVAK